jgi:hypothetical protein
MKHRNTVTPDLVILRKFISYALCKGRENSYKCAVLVLSIRKTRVETRNRQMAQLWRQPLNISATFPYSLFIFSTCYFIHLVLTWYLRVLVSYTPPLERESWPFRVNRNQMAGHLLSRFVTTWSEPPSHFSLKESAFKDRMLLGDGREETYLLRLIPAVATTWTYGICVKWLLGELTG